MQRRLFSTAAARVWDPFPGMLDYSPWEGEDGMEVGAWGEAPLGGGGLSPPSSPSPSPAASRCQKGDEVLKQL